MAFTWPVMLWALLALPLLVWAYLVVLRRQRRMQERLADSHLLAYLVAPVSAWRRHLPVAIYLGAVLLLVLAMARPIAAIPLPVNRAAVVIAIDTSKSMIAEDVKPNRLEAAKNAARDFVKAMPPSARIGLIAFSDYGTVLVPPSTDRQALDEALNRLQPQQATAVGSAILEALRVLPLRKEVLGGRVGARAGPLPRGGPAAAGSAANPRARPAGPAAIRERVTAGCHPDLLRRRLEPRCRPARRGGAGGGGEGQNPRARAGAAGRHGADLPGPAGP